MLNLMLIAAVIGAVQGGHAGPPTRLEYDRDGFSVRVLDTRHLAGPPRLDMYYLNHGGPKELRFKFAYIEKDEPPGEFDIRITVVDPASGATVVRDVRRVGARRYPGHDMAFFYEPKGPQPKDASSSFYEAEFRRKLAPGKYRVTVSAGGVISMTRDYIVRAE